MGIDAPACKDVKEAPLRVGGYRVIKYHRGNRPLAASVSAVNSTNTISVS